MFSRDKEFLRRAIKKAEDSLAEGGFPAGAVIAKNGKVVGEGISIGNKLNDPSSHGEMAAIRQASFNQKSSDLSGSVLYASMQPCLMCFGAAMWSGISKIVFACSKESVSSEYYGGHYCVSEINAHLIHPIELVHSSDFEDEVLAIVHKWEKALKT